MGEDLAVGYIAPTTLIQILYVSTQFAMQALSYMGCTYEHNLHPEWIRVTVHRAWLEWAKFSHHDHHCVHMSTTYILSEYKSPSTAHGWNEQNFHFMIINVYIWEQLTGWVNPSHRPQGMIGMSKVFTSWSSACTYEHNLHPEWIRVTVHRAWLEWARFSHHDHHYVHVHMSTTYRLSESESRSTGHGWNEQCFHIMIISTSAYIWAQLTSWVNPSHRPQGIVG